MAKKAVTERGACIRVTCEAFRISESCYRYARKLDAENEEVANWLIRLTDIPWHQIASSNLCQPEGF